MSMNENFQINAAPDALQEGAAQDASAAEGASVARKGWQAPQLTDHGTVAERTGDQGLDFTYMALS